MECATFSQKYSFIKHFATVLVFVIFVLFLHHSSFAEEVAEIPPQQTEAQAETESTTEEIPVSDIVPSEQEVSEVNHEPLADPDPEQEPEEVIEQQITENQDTPAITTISQNPIIQEFAIEEEEETPPEKIFEESIEDVFQEPFFIPKNLPKVPAFTDYEGLEIDTDAVHECHVRDFSVDLSILPNKNNSIIVSNPTLSSANLEVIGLPRGLELIFTKTQDTEIAVATGQKEIPFELQKVGDIQKGNFNIVFLFSRKIGSGESTTTCQMNIIL